MQTVIGLGKAGCNIADHLSQYPQYQIKKIDVGLKNRPRLHLVLSIRAVPNFMNPLNYRKV